MPSTRLQRAAPVALRGETRAQAHCPLYDLLERPARNPAAPRVPDYTGDDVRLLYDIAPRYVHISRDRPCPWWGTGSSGSNGRERLPGVRSCRQRKVQIPAASVAKSPIPPVPLADTVVVLAVLAALGVDLQTRPAPHAEPITL